MPQAVMKNTILLEKWPAGEALGEFAPGRTKHRVEHETRVARRPTAATDRERFEIRPLIVEAKRQL
jgi:hypothetical protein